MHTHYILYYKIYECTNKNRTYELVFFSATEITPLVDRVYSLTLRLEAFACLSHYKFISSFQPLKITFPFSRLNLFFSSFLSVFLFFIS